MWGVQVSFHCLENIHYEDSDSHKPGKLLYLEYFNCFMLSDSIPKLWLLLASLASCLLFNVLAGRLVGHHSCPAPTSLAF